MQGATGGCGSDEQTRLECQAFQKNTKMDLGQETGSHVACHPCTIYLRCLRASLLFRPSVRISFMAVAFQHFVLLFIRNSK